MAFSTRLTQAIRDKKTPVLVGLDPRFSLIPESFRRGVDCSDFCAVAEVYRQFCYRVLELVAPRVACVKPQLAFFEAIGPSGMLALADVIQYARKLGLLVILDGKRNDIGSTAEGYAAAYLGEKSAWGGDALTVSPYLGEDSLTPFVRVAEAQDAGIFVLVKTSNPGGGMLQDLQSEGKTLYAHVADWVERTSAESALKTQEAYGPVGAVVGATYPEQLAELRERMPHVWLLVPGFGAQGGTAQSVKAAFHANGLGAIINNSRGILYAHTQPQYADRTWEQAVEASTQNMAEQLSNL